MSGQYSDYRSRLNDFGVFTTLSQPRTTLPDRDITSKGWGAGVPPQVVGSGADRHLEWVHEVAYPKTVHSDAERLKKAKELLSGLEGAPHRLRLSIDPDGMLRVSHQCGPMHEAVEMRLRHNWKDFGGGPVRVVGVRGEMYASLQSDSTLGPQPVSVLRRAIRTNCGQLDVDALALSGTERKLLQKWGSSGDLAATLLERIGSAPADRAAMLGRAQDLAELGVFSPFVVDALKILSERYEQNTLADVSLRYNGHAMFSVAPLCWAATRAFPSKSFSLLASKYSGNRESGNLLGFLMRPGDELLSRGEDDKYQMHPIEHRFEAPAKLPLLASKVLPKERFIWEKAAELLQRSSMKEAIASGVHRFIIHNADDLKAADKAGNTNFYGVELWSSRIKALEARFIGEAFALLGAREVRTHWKNQIGNCEVRVIGAGLLGMGVAQAFERFKMNKDQVLIIDSDPEVRLRAAQLGFRTASPDDVPPAKAKTVCFVATGGACIDGDNVQTFGKDAIVFGLNSGGKVIDPHGTPLDVIEKHPVGFSWDVDTGRGEGATYRDQDQRIRLDDGSQIKLHVVAEYMPANLLYEQWPDRFHVTGMGVTAAALQLAKLDHAEVAPFDPKVDDALVSLAEKHGLLEPRPLDPRYDENPAELLQDLKFGFSRSGPLLMA